MNIESRRPPGSMTPSRRAGLVLVSMAIAGGIAISGCASSSSSGGSGSASAAVTASTPSCVPAAPTQLPEDPDGVVAGLTGAAKDAMAGYPGPVHKSPWANFVASHPAPWTIGMANNEGNANANQWNSGVEAAMAAHPGKFNKPIIVTAYPANDATSQVQNMRSLVQRKVDVIIATLGTPALNAVIDEAKAQGIPVIGIEGQASDINAIGMQANPTQLGYEGAKGLVTRMGGKGNVLIVQSIPGLPINTQVLQAANKVFTACSGIHVIGSVAGYFDPSIAKTATLTFLATHPQSVDGVFQVSNMAYGVIGAFVQSGRKVPPVADLGGNDASLAYWADNKDYPGIGVGTPVTPLGQYAGELAYGMLSGRGMKSTDAPYLPIPITSSNLHQWVTADMTTSSDGYADGPPGAIPIEQLLNGFFEK